MRATQRKLNLFEKKRQKIKRPSNPHIHSDSYSKKYEQGLPKVNERQIPTHYLYDFHVPLNDIQEEKSLEAWAIIPKQNRRLATNQDPEQKQKMKMTLYDIMIDKYLNRRRKRNKFYSPIPFYKSEVTKKSTSNMKRLQPKALVQFKRKSKSNLKEHHYGTQNPQQITFSPPDDFVELASLCHTNLKQMSIKELETSIGWKKAFLSALEGRQSHRGVRSISRSINTRKQTPQLVKFQIH